MLTSFCTLLDIVNGPFLRDPNYLQNWTSILAFVYSVWVGLTPAMARYEKAHPDRVINLEYADL